MIIERASKFLFIVTCFVSLGSFKIPVKKITSSDHSYPVPHINMEKDILYYVNLHRKSVGLHPLQLNNIESSIAARHSYNMATGKTSFGHVGLRKRMNDISKQLGRITATGENVAYGQMSAKEVVEGWLNSPGHRRNIEGNFTLTGIGIARDKKGAIYYTQIFTK
ncbi:MAG: CAP domain-containing protein [Bacteroidetes bacterium]|nr:CAP domain-containing protein [Bacteroidota bacterium]